MQEGQCPAIRFRFFEVLGADDAAGAGDVRDHDFGTQPGFQERFQNTGRRVVAAAGRERYDPADRRAGERVTRVIGGARRFRAGPDQGAGDRQGDDDRQGHDDRQSHGAGRQSGARKHRSGHGPPRSCVN